MSRPRPDYLLDTGAMTSIIWPVAQIGFGWTGPSILISLA
jgi:hypothetical protein